MAGWLAGPVAVSVDDGEWTSKGGGEGSNLCLMPPPACAGRWLRGARPSELSPLMWVTRSLKSLPPPAPSHVANDRYRLRPRGECGSPWLTGSLRPPLKKRSFGINNK